MDDVGIDLVGIYEAIDTAAGRPAGSPAYTPVIDNLLAAQGMTFTQAWSAPMCSPTRAQILTGNLGFRSGVGSIVRANPHGHARNPGLQPDATLLPQVLHAAATPYTCAAVGKWHLADVEQLEAEPAHPLGLPYGNWFDHFAGSRLNLEPPPGGGGGGGGNSYFSWRKLFASTLGSSPCVAPNVGCEVAIYSPPTRNYATADTTEDALALMQTLPEPWFLYVAYNAIHAPVHVAPIDLPSAPCLPSSGPSLACSFTAGNDPASLSRCMLTGLDQQIGRLACAVNSANTTFILIADNGTAPAAIAPPFDPMQAKGTVYEAGVRVPLIVRSPLIPPHLVGSVETRMVHAVDLFATVSEIAQAPALPNGGIDSVSLLPYLTGAQTAPLRRLNYTEGFYPNFRALSPGVPTANYVGHFQNQALRDERFKLVRRTRRDHSNSSLITVTEELYDLLQGGPPDTSVQPPAPTRDWFETNDLLASGAPLPRAASLAYQRLSAALDQHYPSVVR